MTVRHYYCDHGMAEEKQRTTYWDTVFRNMWVVAKC